MNNNKQQSFTLIELLVVIVIIGILAGVIVVSTNSSITSAQNAKLVAELSNLSKALEGYSSYPQGSLCIEDTSSNSSFLSYLGIDTYPKHPNYKVGDTALTTNDCFLYFSDGENYSIRTPAIGNNGYLIQESRHPKTQDIVKSCEPGWIPFGNRCVMKYMASAKNVLTGEIVSCIDNVSCPVSSHIPVSQAAGNIWRNTNLYNSKIACESIGAHLITNAEWMALVRDIEQVDSNWNGTKLRQGKTHNLSNGQVIEDMTYYGLLEWVDEIRLESELPSATGWNEINLINYTSKLPYNEIGPLNKNLNSTNGIGKITISKGERAFFRGLSNNSYGIYEGGGLFTIHLGLSPSSINPPYTAFRCVK